MAERKTRLQIAERKIAEAIRFRDTRLNLDNKRLTTLPESLGQLTQLQELTLNGNRLSTLPKSLAQLTQLVRLALVGNQLSTWPEWLGQLTNLRMLSLSGNRLSTLPESLVQLTQLRELHLNSNQLTALPESFGRLKQLQELHLGSNQLSALPESFGRLTQLVWLDLYGNQLRTLPESLQRLSLLKRVFLHGNSALGIPNEVLQHDREPAKILDYYFSTRAGAGRALRELKLIVVGRGGAGKTSLIRRLKRLALDRHESETHGIVISPLKLHCGDGPVTARVWDFGGQHVLHAMHEFFLTARSLYLLVLGERDDMAERDAAYWLQLIRSYAGAVPVVVAVNKSQGRPREKEMDRETLEANYGPIVGWVATECDDNVTGSDESIESLRTALTVAADGMKEVRNVFPAKWWEIKQWLEGMVEPYLDFPTYQTRCGELGESDGAKQEQLAEWLHDLGVALNYARDPRLHDTTVLRPDWLANGIYALLRANDPRHAERLAPDAVLTTERLGPIYAASEKLQMLKAADYPAEKWEFLLRLMNMFQLAFPLDDAATRLLVPTLLPVEPPGGSDEPPDADRTRLRYEFEVVPGPLIPRFLVRNFSLIDGERRWRRGAILRYATAHARVWATQDERWVHVTADGPQKERDELLTMIRGELASLFTEYKDLRVVEQWEHKGDWVPRTTLERIGVLPVEQQAKEVEP